MSAREFLAKVLPWPQEGSAPAFVNIHWTVPNTRGGKALWVGRACRSLDEAVRAVDWAMTKPDTRDVYFCTSTQSEAIPAKSKTGFEYLKPSRSQQNVVSLKSLFLDLDAKGEDNASYATISAAGVALSEFITKMALPKPSAIVASGGGLHVYWTFDRPLDVHEWQPLALALAEATKVHGLKCDTQCTIDSARVLRVPGTLNHKRDPAKPVTLAGNRVGHDYSIDRLRLALQPYVKAEAPPVLPRRAAITGVSELSAGIERGNFGPVDLDDVAKECKFLADTLADGGASNDNPLWNLTTLISTFTKGQGADATRLSSGHVGYTAASTQELFERKERDRQSKGLGWPACRTISGTGAKQCAQCVHFAKDKTPLHFAAAKPVAQVPAQLLVRGPSGSNPTGAVSGQVAGTAGGNPAAVGDLPLGYKRLASNIVCQILINADGTTTEEPVCTYPLFDPTINTHPDYVLNFNTINSSGGSTQIAIPTELLSSKDSMRRAFLRNGVAIRDHEAKRLMEFLMSWIEKLQKQKDAVVSSQPYGWSTDTKSNIEGFVFAGSIWSPTGSKNALMSDATLAHRYKPKGRRDPWITAAKMITDQERPALDAIIASSFGAPLIRFCNEPGVLMSTWSAASGIGKTSAMKVAQAVWGDPIRAMQGLDDTSNFVFGKIGKLQNLPMYWDELKTDTDAKAFVKIAFKLTNRKEKDRMTQTVQMRESGAWQTLLVSASNESILDYVAQYTKNTPAGMNRVFEYEVFPAHPHGPGQIDQADASAILGKLDDNYGHVGLEYAQYLGSNHATIGPDVAAFYKAVGNQMSVKNEERYWRVMVACLLKGAEYSNKLGYTNIDGIRLKKFLFSVVDNLRTGKKLANNDLAVAFNVGSVLQDFLSESRARHTIRTNMIHRARGKPPIGSIKTVSDTSRLEGIHVHIGMGCKTMRISQSVFGKWLRDNHHSVTSMYKAMAKELNAKFMKGRIASGTDYAGIEENLIDIDLKQSPHIDFISEA